MAILDFIKNLVKNNKQSNPVFRWEIERNPIESGINFIMPPQAVNSIEKYAIESPLFSFQYAYLQTLLEQEQAHRFPNGFFVPAEIITDLDDNFAQLFKFPPLFKGNYEAVVNHKTSNVAFDVRYKLLMEDGDKISSYNLAGPFLEISSNEIYRLTRYEWQTLKALDIHQNLPLDVKTEFENNKLVYQLQLAQKQGMRVNLAHFDSIEVIMPEKVGVAVQELSDGSIELTPSFQGINIDDIRQRTGQLSQDGKQLLKVKNKSVLFDEMQLEAIHEILTKRHISKSQVKTFLESPTAFLNSSLIDLDVGFSIRVFGAEKFTHHYFGETEKSGIQWFGSMTTLVEPPEALMAIINDPITLSDVEELIGNARATGADCIEVQGHQIDISEFDNVEKVINHIRKQIYQENQDLENPPTTESETGKNDSTTIVIGIDSNDEQATFSGYIQQIDEELKSNQQDFARDNLKRLPFPHQEEGIKWLLAHLSISQQKNMPSGSGGLLADDMGLGKTYMTLVAVNEFYRRLEAQNGVAKPVLIVAPLSLLENWKAEIEETFIQSPFKDIVILQSDGDLKRFKHGGSEIRQYIGENDIVPLDTIYHSLKVGEKYGNRRLDVPQRLVLATYQTLRDYQFSLSKVDWSIAIFDEAQNLKNPNALVTRAAKALKADFKLLATGTPVENSLKDFWCLMDTVAPGLFGAWKQFREEYIQPILDSQEQENANDVKIEIGKKLRQKTGQYMLRRTKAEKLKGLPQKYVYSGDREDKNYLSILDAQMSGEQLASYNKIINDVKYSTVEDKREIILSSLRQLKVTSIHHNLVVNENLLAEAYLSAKITSLMKLLEQIKSRNEKVLIFAETKVVQAYLTALITLSFGIMPDIINGETKAIATVKDNQTRKAIIDKFQAQAGFNVLIMSPIAAGVGLTITGANNVIHLERHWNPAKEAQATDRVYRIGQQKDVNVYLPMATHPNIRSFDLQIHQLLSNKIDLSNAVVASSNITPQDVIAIFN
ncbi:helicase SNF2 [Pasteurellaceae bacterium 15-036681]|nr:helicase SNF2 [Pasteurellaceae bacterium 15-036681]